MYVANTSHVAGRSIIHALHKVSLEYELLMCCGGGHTQLCGSGARVCGRAVSRQAVSGWVVSECAQVIVYAHVRACIGRRA